MNLIADSGSSKTDWLFTSGTYEEQIVSPGINPFFQNTIEITQNLIPVFADFDKASVEKIFFYGAGCIKGKTDMIVSDALKEIFPSAEIHVSDDMLGAARALLNKEKGIACILGTGANSCYYNGNEIEDKVPTLGFILGDEGSGAHLGKLFLNDYYKRALPADLKADIDFDFKTDMADVLTAVYREEYPSRYLAQFSKILSKYKQHEYVHNLIKRSFSEFFLRNIERYANYKELKVNFVGSIAFHYSDFLKEVALERGISIGNIIEKPIQGLRSYHTNA